MNGLITGAKALAMGAFESGVGAVTGYPGSPATYVVNDILGLTGPQETHVEWTSNEKTAAEIAFGASLGGRRSLLCIKGVGLNIALDPLMTMNLSGCNAGFVILVGDDPGGWGSQNEQDSRVLAGLMEVPWLEPSTVADARAAMRMAFTLSEETSVPVVVRITRALALAQHEIPEDVLVEAILSDPPTFRRDFMRWVVLPVNVVPNHRRLIDRLDAVLDRFETSALNDATGNGSLGVLAAGFAYQKLLDLVGGRPPQDLRLFRLGTYYPFPERRVVEFLQTVESVLVLEETTPLVERNTRASAQAAGLTLPILGRDSGHIPRVGELFAPHLARALNRCVPGLTYHNDGATDRPRPSRDPLCEGCPYVPTFDALPEAMKALGGRDDFILVGDPGCMVRAQLPPYELMDVKHSLGSAIGMAAGIALSQTDRRVVALCGDSGFLHSGLNALIDAARLGLPMLLVILDNGTTALSGRQPHPGSPVDIRGLPRPVVDLESLARAAGVTSVTVVDVDRGENIRASLDACLNIDGLSVVIARGRCVLLD